MKYILLERVENISIVRICREQKLNALNREVLEELSATIDILDKDTDVRAIIITGSGDKSFVAGADISEFQNISDEKAKKISAYGQHVFYNQIAKCNVPVIAAINGYALGGGLELAMACHIRIACETAKLGLPEASLGILPGYGGTYALAKLVGMGKAIEIMCTTKKIDVNEALAIGLINTISSKGEVLNDALKLAKRMISNSPVAIAKILQLVSAESDNALLKEQNAFASCFKEQDVIEGVQAFIEKRKPKF